MKNPPFEDLSVGKAEQRPDTQLSMTECHCLIDTSSRMIIISAELLPMLEKSKGLIERVAGHDPLLSKNVNIQENVM